MDTLTISQNLINAGFERKQAEVVAKTIKQEVEERNNELSTKYDIELLKKDVKNLQWIMIAGITVIGIGFGYLLNAINNNHDLLSTLISVFPSVVK